MSKLSSIFSKMPVFTVFLAASLALFPAAASAADEADETDETPDLASVPAQAVPSPWPVQFTEQGRRFLIYQPQVDRWENNLLEGRSAVLVRDEGAGRQNFGVVYFSARTTLDPDSPTVTVSDPVVSKIDFPALAGAGGADDYTAALRAQFATQSWQIAQERLQSDMEIDRYAQQASKQPLKNDPPRIVYSERPAVLVPVDGAPVLRPVGDTGLMRVTNTRALLLQDKASARYYLFVSNEWMTAPRLEGPWSVAVNPPAQLEQAKQIATQQDQVDLLEADAGSDVTPTALSVVVSTGPAELLQTEGPAQYAPIEGTQLLYVTNSPNKLFLDLRTQNHYALISGRWFRTTALAQGQWNYVPPAQLPADFAMIPAQHPTESVRAAVPGTPQAREAVIANTIPQVATVARKSAHLEVAYDGDPVFQPIEGTQLQNAVNAPVPVIRVSEDTFYALDNGVWFVAASPFGPWTVASFVPPVIYSIPVSSPLHYVTYVRVYDATPEVVYVGYTPGYVGSYVSSDNVVVYGTGWPYRPWIGSVWYGAPVTWGFGFSFVYSWWNPYPWHWHRSAWTPYHHHHYYRPGWGPWHAHGYARRGFGPAGVAGRHRDAPRSHNIGRIYDRWDRGGVVWNGPRAITNPRRSAGPALGRAQPGSAFTPGNDTRWRRSGDDGNRGRAGRDANFRGNPANSPAGQSPRADRTPPAVQTPWRRHAPAANQDDRGRRQSPPIGSNERRPEARQFPQRERVFEQRQGNDGVRPPVNGRSTEGRPRADFQRDRGQAMPPREQAPQRMPPVAGPPIDRAQAQPQRAMPQRNFSAPAPRVERPAAGNDGRNFQRPSMGPGRIERPAATGGGRGFERPSMGSGRSVERAAGRPQFQGNGGHRQPNAGGGGGGHRQPNGGGGGGWHRPGADR